MAILNKYINQSDLTEVGILVDTNPNSQLSFDQNALIAMSSARINNLTGGYIDKIGFINLNQAQQTAVKKSTLWLVADWNSAGLSFTRINGAIGTGIGSYSQSNPKEPDYIRSDIIDELTNAGLIRISDDFTDLRSKASCSNLDNQPIPRNIKSYIDNFFVNILKFTSKDGSIILEKGYNFGATLDLKTKASANNLGYQWKYFPLGTSWKEIYDWGINNLVTYFVGYPTNAQAIGYVGYQEGTNLALVYIAGDTYEIVKIDSNGNVLSDDFFTFVNDQSNIYEIVKEILNAGTNVDLDKNDANSTIDISSTGGRGIKTFDDKDTQSSVFSKINIGDRVRFTQNNAVVNVYDTSSQGIVILKDATSATFLLQKEGPGYDLVSAIINNGATGIVIAEPTVPKIQALDINVENGEFPARIDKIKAYVDSKGSGDGAPWILFTGAQYLQQINDQNQEAQKIFEIPIDMSGVKKFISCGYTVQAQLIDNNANVGPIKYTSSKWTTTFNAYIDATQPAITNQVKVEYAGNGSLAVRTWYFIDKVTDPAQWTFNTYMALTNFTTDHFDWFEFFGGVGAPNTVGLERSHILVPPAPDDRRNFQAYSAPARFGINPDWTEFTNTPSINGNYNDIQELNTLVDNYGNMKIKVDATNTYKTFLDYSATNTATNPILTLEGATAIAGKPSWVLKDLNDYKPDDAIDYGKLCRVTITDSTSGTAVNKTYYGQLGSRSFLGFNQLTTSAPEGWTTETIYISINGFGTSWLQNTTYCLKQEQFFIPSKPQRTNIHLFWDSTDTKRVLTFVEVWE